MSLSTCSRGADPRVKTYGSDLLERVDCFKVAARGCQDSLGRDGRDAEVLGFSL